MARAAPGHRGALTLGAFLPYRLSVLTNRVSRTLARLYAERFDLSIAQWRVLAVLGETPGQCADDICRVTEMDKVTVSRAVRSLLDQGRVTRTTDDADRRRARIELTGDGEAVYRRVVPLALGLERSLLAGLSETERRQLDHLVEKLTELTADFDDDDAPEFGAGAGSGN